MPTRIYALAKCLGFDSKEMVQHCRKAGIKGKGSSLASLDDNEVQQLKDYLEIDVRENVTDALHLPPLCLSDVYRLSPHMQVVELQSILEALLKTLTHGRLRHPSYHEFAKRVDYAVQQGWMDDPESVFKANKTRNAICHRDLRRPFPSKAAIATARDVFETSIRALVEFCDAGVRQRVLTET